LGGEISAFDNKHTENLSISNKPQSQIGTGSSLAPTLKFTNSGAGQNINTSAIEKSPQQLREEEI